MRTAEESRIFEEVVIRISNIETLEDWNATNEIIGLIALEGGLTPQDCEVFGSILARIMTGLEA